jgi:MFS family permease
VLGWSLRRWSGVSAPLHLPFFYGWVIVAVVFVTMGLGVNARTAFALLFPPLLDECGWERGMTAGAFSFGFLVSAGLSPFVGHLMDRRGPRVVIEMGVGLMAAVRTVWAIPGNRSSSPTGSCGGVVWP